MTSQKTKRDIVWEQKRDAYMRRQQLQPSNHHTKPEYNRVATGYGDPPPTSHWDAIVQGEVEVGVGFNPKVPQPRRTSSASSSAMGSRLSSAESNTAKPVAFPSVVAPPQLSLQPGRSDLSQQQVPAQPEAHYGRRAQTNQNVDYGGKSNTVEGNRISSGGFMDGFSQPAGKSSSSPTGTPSPSQHRHRPPPPPPQPESGFMAGFGQSGPPSRARKNNTFQSQGYAPIGSRPF